MDSDSLSVQAHQAVTALMHCHVCCATRAATVMLESDARGRPQHVRLLSDASAMALATADALMRKSQFNSQFARLCSAICETCAQDCENMQAPSCAQACRAAAKACDGLDAPEKADILKMASRLAPGEGSGDGIKA